MEYPPVLWKHGVLTTGPPGKYQEQKFQQTGITSSAGTFRHKENENNLVIMTTRPHPKLKMES